LSGCHDSPELYAASVSSRKDCQWSARLDEPHVGRWKGDGNVHFISQKILGRPKLSVSQISAISYVCEALGMQQLLCDELR
jgi:hypothetical protein